MEIKHKTKVAKEFKKTIIEYLRFVIKTNTPQKCQEKVKRLNKRKKVLILYIIIFWWLQCMFNLSCFFVDTIYMVQGPVFEWLEALEPYIWQVFCTHNNFILICHYCEVDMIQGLQLWCYACVLVKLRDKA